ncbi:MAG: MotA/TolQ/ExbB proton channel family protein [Planctomycetota bacterium]
MRDSSTSHTGTACDQSERAPDRRDQACDLVSPNSYHSPATDIKLACEGGETPTGMHRHRNVVSVIVGVVGFLAVWGCALQMGTGGDVAGAFFDVPSALLVLIAPLAIMIAVYGWAGVIDACWWVFRKPTPGKAAEEAVGFWQLWGAFALASGFLGTMVGMIVLLTWMEDPSRIGGGMAVALLTQLYGVFVAVICIALAAHIGRRHNGPGSVGHLARRGAGVAGITTIAGVLTAMVCFGILMLSLAPSF